MIKVSEFKLRPVVIDDYEFLFSLRNDPSIRIYMFNSEPISWQKHREWFDSSFDCDTKELLIMEHKGVSCAFMSLSKTKYRGVLEWGFYTIPNQKKRYGTALGFLTLNHVFRQQGVRKIYGKVLSKNVRSINLHLKMGFALEGCLREQHESSGDIQDVYLFGLTRNGYSNLEKESYV